MSISFGVRPDVTPAHLAGVLLAGLPVAANLLRGLGVYDASKDQQQALRDAGRWGAISAIGLVLADAGLRSARCHADAQVHVASLSPAQAGVAGAPVEPPVTHQPKGTGVVDEEEGTLLEELQAGLLSVDAAGLVDEEEAALLEELDAGLLPTDAEELGAGEEPEASMTPDDPDAP